MSFTSCWELRNFLESAAPLLAWDGSCSSVAEAPASNFVDTPPLSVVSASYRSGRVSFEAPCASFFCAHLVFLLTFLRFEMFFFFLLKRDKVQGCSRRGYGLFQSMAYFMRTGKSNLLLLRACDFLLFFVFSSAGVTRGRSSVRGGSSGYGSAGSMGSRTSRGSSTRYTSGRTVRQACAYKILGSSPIAFTTGNPFWDTLLGISIRRSLGALKGL